MFAGCGSTSPVEPSALGPRGTATGTYYIATNEPGADNERCDGRSPVNAGNGNCPFKDFASPRTSHLLTNVAGVRVEVRAGTYSFHGGITVQGTGTSDAERIVLAAYGGEPVIFDGQNVVRELVRVSGQYVTVQGLTLQHAGAHNLEVRGGRHVLIEGNRFLANRASDSLKGDAGASDVHVLGNEFTGWDSQAIDITGVQQWRIEGNQFHDPRGIDARAIGIKFGTRDVLIANNQFWNTPGLSLGGEGSTQPIDQTAYKISVERNTFRDISSPVASFYSCAGCEFRDNIVSNAAGGIQLSVVQAVGSTSCAAGCQPNRDIVVAGNRLRGLAGGRQGVPNMFWSVAASETGGFSARDNLYCREPAHSARFLYGGRVLGFEEWTRTVATDWTSVVASRDDNQCSSW